MTLPIHEVFHAFQGEGIYVGQSAFFIRTFGCPLQCPWCDSAGTWHRDFRPAKVAHITIKELVASAVESGASFCVITGGEPTIQKALPDLCSALLEKGIAPHIETSGAYDVSLPLGTWITVSPKKAKLPTKSMLIRADELKLIVEDSNSVSAWSQTLEGITGFSLILMGIPVWLHPEWSKRDNSDVLNAITHAVKSGRLFRAGWQTHKLYRCDSLDGRSAALAPLGGNPALGF